MSPGLTYEPRDPSSSEVMVLPPLAVTANQEVNHRVANSLQLLYALLSSQRSGAAHAETREVIEMALGRISAIAGIHRQLYRSAEERKVGLADYLLDLVIDLEAGCGRGVRYGRIRLDAEQIYVSAEFASSVGILVTELVMNACKHAYAPGERGDIDVRLAHTGSREFRLEVQDFGSRGGRGADHRTAGLGSHLIDLIARRLGERHGYSAEPRGTRFVLSGHIPTSAA